MCFFMSEKYQIKNLCHKKTGSCLHLFNRPKLSTYSLKNSVYKALFNIILNRVPGSSRH